MATIAEERAANARARAEGYESAAHKEMHANVAKSLQNETKRRPK